MKQGNGPRDMGISIRSSNARNGFGVRNIVILEDDFPVTQPDGLSRSDLIDPHAYSGIDVWRGPSSALFGNYTTGGAFNFRTRPGGEINGVEYGVDVGSFNYLNNYVSAGTKTWNFEGSVSSVMCAAIYADDQHAALLSADRVRQDHSQGDRQRTRYGVADSHVP